jgi:alcohol dehydrogenase (cytochrome c)
LGSGIIRQPITSLGPDGKQYVAILSGVGGWAGAIVAGDLAPGAALRRGDLSMPCGTAAVSCKEGLLYVFSLP